MARAMVHLAGASVMILLMMVVVAEAARTPPGIANNPSHATCKNKQFKECYNLPHVCPKFCPDSCHVECASCKPICGPGGDDDAQTTSPPEDDDNTKPKKGGDDDDKEKDDNDKGKPKKDKDDDDKKEKDDDDKGKPKKDKDEDDKKEKDDDDKGKGKGDDKGEGDDDDKKNPTPSPPVYPKPSPPSVPTPSPPVYPTPPSVPTPSPPVSPTPPSVPSTPTPTPPVSPTPPFVPSTPTPTPPASPTPPSVPSTPTPTPPVSPTPPSEPTPAPPVSPTPPSVPTPTPTPPVSPTPPSAPTLTPPVYPTPPVSPTSPSEPTPTPTPTTPTPAPTPPSSGVSPKKVKCKDYKYTTCYNVEHVCPKSCPGGCEVDCATCKPICSCDKPGHVCQDPRFIGGDGITFYFHGKKNRDFCLLSDSNLHINAHFIGRRNQDMRRDFTWVQAIGILFDNHQIYIGAQKTATWDDSVDRLALSFDGQPIYLPQSEGAKWQSEIAPSVTITRSSVTNAITVEVEGNFKITANVVPITEEDSRVHNYGITKDDCFAHLDLGFKFYSLSEEVNGVLGQTYGKDYVSKVKMGVTMPVMGGDKKFITSSVFSNDCAVARFTGSKAPSEMAKYASLTCASGMDGRGVVCKR